jgi:hypothetical protein
LPFLFSNPPSSHPSSPRLLLAFTRWLMIHLLLGYIILTPLALKASDTPTNTIRISIVDAKPWGWKENDRQAGILVELATTLSQELGMPVEVLTGSVSRVIRQVTLGQSDFIYFMVHPDLEKHATKIASLGQFNLQLWQLSGQPNQGLNTKSLAGMAIATSIQDIAGLPPLTEANISLVHSADLLIPMLMSGRAKGIIELEPVLKFSSLTHNYSLDWFSKRTLLHAPTHLWLSNQSKLAPEMIRKVKRAAEKVNRPEDVKRTLQLFFASRRKAKL